MERLRRSVIAGTWYPGEPAILKGEINDYLRHVPDEAMEGEIAGVVAPHAGYQYSGQVAAYAYKRLCGRAYDAVILIAPSHRVAFSGVSIYGDGAYETPLGKIPVDERLAQTLIKGSTIIRDYPAAHAQEHSVEIHLPFLQVALGRFAFVPLIMGSQDAETCRELSSVILKASSGRKVLVVGSTDLSHFHSYNEAIDLDSIVIGHIRNFDADGLLDSLSAGKVEACGGGPMAVTMLAAKKMGAKQAHLLKYANSGDVTGDKRSVVGYVSAVFC